MFNIEAFSTRAALPTRAISLGKPICAIQMAFDDEGSGKLGLLSHLGAGTTVEVCGDGFNDRTVKVRANDHLYFVFLQDLDQHEAARAWA